MKIYHYLFLIIISFLIGCSESSSPIETNYDSSINGKSIVIRPNQKYILELDLNADAGYSWTYTIANPKVINIDSTKYRAKSGKPNQVGGLTVETFYFSGKSTGQCFINLIEHQVWMKNVPPINTVRFNVIVR